MDALLEAAAHDPMAAADSHFEDERSSPEETQTNVSSEMTPLFNDDAPFMDVSITNFSPRDNKMIYEISTWVLPPKIFLTADASHLSLARKAAVATLEL